MKKVILFISVFVFLSLFSLKANVINVISNNDTFNAFIIPGDSEKPDVSIFPNPLLDGKLNIKSSESIKEIEILSIVGKVVYNEKIEDKNKVTLDLDNLDKGLYIVKVKLDKEQTITEKLMVR